MEKASDFPGWKNSSEQNQKWKREGILSKNYKKRFDNRGKSIYKYNKDLIYPKKRFDAINLNIDRKVNMSIWEFLLV